MPATMLLQEFCLLTTLYSIAVYTKFYLSAEFVVSHLESGFCVEFKPQVQNENKIHCMCNVCV